MRASYAKAVVALPGLAAPDDAAHPADRLSDDDEEEEEEEEDDAAAAASSDTSGLEKARDSGRTI